MIVDNDYREHLLALLALVERKTVAVERIAEALEALIRWPVSQPTERQCGETAEEAGDGQ